jgi:hypothetical protein
VRDENFKLYRDRRFYQVPNDLNEATDLAVGQAGERGEIARSQLGQALETAPPAPLIEGGNRVTNRPVYPEWMNIVNPND